VLIEGLRKNGVDVVECNSRQRGLLKYVSLFFQFILKAQKIDAIVVGFPMGRGVVVLLRCFVFGMDLLQHATADNASQQRMPMIIDGFVSQYDAEALDRKHLEESSREAKRLFEWERDAFLFASKVLVDTNANAEYYSKLFSIPRERFVVIPVGTDEALFHPQVPPRKIRGGVGAGMNFNTHDPASSYLQRERNDKDVIVHFSGTYNPLQGIDVIIRAVHHVRMRHPELFHNDGGSAAEGGLRLRFRLVGNGEEHERVVQLARELNVFDRIDFIDRVPYDEYAWFTASADICLGIFSDSPKANRVIPNKVVEAMACGKAIITADTPAIRELLLDRENAVLCRPNDPHDLAERIVELFHDLHLQIKLGENARRLFLEKLATKKIGMLLKETLEHVCLQTQIRSREMMVED